MVDYAIGKHGIPAPPGPIELGGIPPNTELTDKIITDYLLDQHNFHCDALDTNTVLYVWQEGYWQRGIHEGIINKELSKIFSNEKSRGKMQLEKTIIFIKGMAMTNIVTPHPTHKISFTNGLLDLSTMELGKHDKSLFTVNQIPHDFDHTAECPKWLAWLQDTVPGEDISFIQEWVGYQFYSTVPESAFTVLTGSGQNGKTIFMDLLVEIVGERNNTDISLPALTYDDFSRAQLHFKLSNICDDLGNTLIKNAGELKKASSGSMMNAQHKFGHPFDFRNYAKLTYACNEPPEIRDQSDAIKMRLKCIQFPYTFTKEPTEKQKQARDRGEIMRELQAEIPGIIRWGVEGLRRFLDNNSTFSTSRSTEEMWEFYRRKSMPVLSFANECLEATDDDNDKLSIKQMYDAFTEWLDVHEINLKVSKRKMLADLKEEGITTRRKRDDDQKSMFYGVLCSCAEFPLTVEVRSEREVGIQKTLHRRTDESDRDEGYDEGYRSPG